MFLDIDLVEHHVFLLGVDVLLHFHGNMLGQDREEKSFLSGVQKERSIMVFITAVILLE